MQKQNRTAKLIELIADENLTPKYEFLHYPTTFEGSIQEKNPTLILLSHKNQNLITPKVIIEGATQSFEKEYDNSLVKLMEEYNGLFKLTLSLAERGAEYTKFEKSFMSNPGKINKIKKELKELPSILDSTNFMNWYLPFGDENYVLGNPGLRLFSEMSMLLVFANIYRDPKRAMVFFNSPSIPRPIFRRCEATV